MFIIVELYDNSKDISDIFGPYETYNAAKEKVCDCKRIDNKHAEKRHYYIINLDDHEEI